MGNVLRLFFLKERFSSLTVNLIHHKFQKNCVYHNRHFNFVLLISCAMCELHLHHELIKDFSCGH